MFEQDWPREWPTGQDVDALCRADTALLDCPPLGGGARALRALAYLRLRQAKWLLWQAEDEHQRAVASVSIDLLEAERGYVRGKGDE